MKRNEEQNICQQGVHPGMRWWCGMQRRGWRWRGRHLGDLAVNSSPALVTLTGELVLHVQDIVVVEVSPDVESGAPGCWVVMNVKKARVEVQVNTWIQALTDTSAILLTKGFAAQLSCRGDVDDIMSQRTINVVLYSQTIPLQKQEDMKLFDVLKQGLSSSSLKTNSASHLLWLLNTMYQQLLTE